MKKLFFFMTTVIGLTLFHLPLYSQPVCNTESFPQLPDVTVTSVTQEAQPAPHCKVAGVIGPEINFELLSPEKWNGKFVFGGGARNLLPGFTIGVPLLTGYNGPKKRY